MVVIGYLSFFVMIGVITILSDTSCNSFVLEILKMIPLVIIPHNDWSTHDFVLIEIEPNVTRKTNGYIVKPRKEKSGGPLPSSTKSFHVNFNQC